MELGYEQPKVEQKKSKEPIFIGIALVVCIILAIGVIYAIIYLKNEMLKVKINGSSSSSVKRMLQVEGAGDDVKFYFPIKSIASYLGYTAFTGDFKNKSEDSSKCYVDNGEEIAMFTVNSDSLIISRDKNKSAYEEYTLDEKVFEKDGQLYTTAEGIQKAFEIIYNYDTSTHQIDIYTTPYLASYYAKVLGIDNGKIPEKYTDKQSVLQGLFIIETSDRQYGVMNVVTGKYVLETKYDAVSYIPYSSDFLVKSNNKYGVMTKEGKVKIKIAYDEISLMDNKTGLFLVKEDSLYGVINSNGESVLKANYQQIGISNSTFEKNSLDNQYVLLNTLIPVKYNNMWGFYDVTGKQITNFEFTGVGCEVNSSSNTYSTVVIPNLGYIVVEKDKMYNLMDTTGAMHIGSFVLNSVYLTYDGTTGKNTYYMTYGGNTVDIEEAYKNSRIN